MSELKTPRDVADFLRGANFLSASGGGDPVDERDLGRVKPTDEGRAYPQL